MYLLEIDPSFVPITAVFGDIPLGDEFFPESKFRHKAFESVCLAGKLLAGGCALYGSTGIALHYGGDLVNP